MAPSVVARYAFPLVAVALASVLRGVLVPVLGEGVPFILYFPTVVLCAWFGGLWPGLLSAVLGGLVAAYFFIPPYHSFTAQDPTASAQLIVFLVASTLISLLADRLHRAMRRAQQGEAREREERERLRVALTSVGDGVIVTDDRGRVTLMNGVAQSLTGWREADAIGRSLVDVFTILNEESRRPVENPVARVLREGQIAGLANHTVLIAKDGREIPIDDSAAPIKDVAGTPLGAVLVFRDISQRRQVERDRAMLLDQERAARAEVERLAARQRHLQSVTDTALSPGALDDLVPELLDRLRVAMASDTATILLLAEDGVHLTPFCSVGLPEDPRADIRIPLGHGVAGRIALSDHGLIIDDLTTVEVVRPVLVDRVKSLVGAPLKVGGRLLGILHAGAAEPRRFTDDDLDLLRLAADRAALAIGNRRLLAAEQAARASAEAAERRASFLAEASQLLGASLDYETTLASVARLAVPRMADLCAVDMVEGDGTVRRLAIAHVDPAKETLARELRERYPFDSDATSGVPHVLRTGQSEFLPEVSESLLEPRTRDAEHRRLFRAIGVRSAIIAPRAARGRVLGALTLVHGESQRRHDTADLALAEDLAHRAGLAIDNARLHRETEKAEQRLRLALEAGRMGTWEWTIATGELRWSSSLEAIHAFAPGTFPGSFEAFRSEIHEEDRDRVLRAIAAAVENRRDHRVEYRVVRRDGAVRWVEGRGQLFSDAAGQPERMLGVCTDVTERKQTEERFRLAVEAAPTAMVMVDQRGTIRLVNALAEPLFGYTRPELLGQSIERLVPPRLRDGHSEHRGGFFSDPRQRAMGKGRELYALRKDGTEVPVEIGLSPVETADGLFVLAAVTDITARKQVEHERAQLLVREQTARQEAEAANRKKDQFLAVLSHELRQPLNTMLGWLSVLQHQRVDAAQQQRALDAIERNTRAQARMIDDLLDIARIEAGKVTLDRRAVSVGPLIAETVDALQHEARAKALTLGMQLDPAARLVSADVDRLRQVLTNLLANAIKYTPSGGRVQVGLTAADGVGRIVVSDTGIGIEPDFLPHVFEPFRQTDARSAGAHGGLGLGLAIVREIVEMHGGAVEAQSDGRGRGATFIVTLPTIAGREIPSRLGESPAPDGSRLPPRGGSTLYRHHVGGDAEGHSGRKHVLRGKLCRRARPKKRPARTSDIARGTPMVITAFMKTAVVAAVSVTVAFGGVALAQQPRVLKMQSAVPQSSTTQDAFRFFADRVDKLTGGQLKIETLPGGAIVPPFEILDATHKKVIDGAYGISYWWFGKNKAATLFANTPAGIAGMDAIDFIGWVYDGGGLELWNEFYQKELRLNLVAFPSIPPSPQAMGWFKRPIKDLADFRGMKCRQTGIVAELYSKMGMAVVNMPGGEILPAAERGTIDCAEWVGGVEDQRLGLHTVWKYHYTPGMHESASVAELAINKDVWDSLPAQQKEAIRSATSETFLRWWATWQRMNAEAIAEFVEKHKVQLLTTPPEINKAFLKVWDEFAAAESAKNPFFKKVYQSQRAYASKVVPAKRFMFPPYSFQADHYWPAKPAR